METKRSQTATEYLILLAVVIIIALVVVNTLGGFPGIGSNNNKKVSDYKLQSSAIGIESYSIEVTGSLFKLKNNNYDTVTVTSFRVNQDDNLTCNSSNTNPSLPVVLNVGQDMVVNCSAVNSSNYVITNKQTPLIGITYVDSMGAIRTAGNEGSSVATSNSQEQVAPPVTSVYTVTFNSDGGSTAPSPITDIISGSTITLPADPTKSNYIFSGWFTQTNGGGVQFTNSTAVTGNITVYAKWVAIPVLYYNAAADNDWSNLANWWQDDQYTIPAVALPTSTNNVVLTASVTSNSGSEPVVANLIAIKNPNDLIVSTLEIPVTVVGDVTLGGASGERFANRATLTVGGNVTLQPNSGLNQGTMIVSGDVDLYSYNDRGTITVAGVARFHDIGNGIGGGPTADIGTIINGNAEFYGSSWNNGRVNGNAIFYDQSINMLYGTDGFSGLYGGGFVNGNATFNNDAWNKGNAGVEGYYVVFNDNSHNSGNINGFVTFNDNSHTTSGNLMTAYFFDSSYINGGWINVANLWNGSDMAGGWATKCNFYESSTYSAGAGCTICNGVPCGTPEACSVSDATNPDCWSTDATYSAFLWSTESVNTSGLDVNDGNANTEYIIANYANGAAYDLGSNYPAVRYCYDLNEDYHTDWYLPAINQLVDGITSLGLDLNVGFPSGYYWSSSDSSPHDDNLVMSLRTELYPSGPYNTSRVKYNIGSVKCLR